jgi:hypothetical protein
MSKKIPSDAFQYYFNLGTGRSYQKVAERYSVTKRAVSKLATAERWQEQALEIERKASEGAMQKTIESVEAMNIRHVKSSKVVQAKALEALRSMPISTAMEAVRALDIAMKQERLIRGEPSERTALSVEEVIKKEFADLMVPEEEEEEEKDE